MFLQYSITELNLNPLKRINAVEEIKHLSLILKSDEVVGQNEATHQSWPYCCRKINRIGSPGNPMI